MNTDHTSGTPGQSQFGMADAAYFATGIFTDPGLDSENVDGQSTSSPAELPEVEPGPAAITAEPHQTSPSPIAALKYGASAPPTRSSIDGEIDSIEFRVMRTGAPVRRLRLTGNRYTFGSAEGCSIRLSDTALRPMHAVLIRDSLRVLVRAYSVPIEVNGTRKTEASLQVGDVLRLGSYQFELVSVISRSPSEGLEGFEPASGSVLGSPTASEASFAAGPRPTTSVPRSDGAATFTDASPVQPSASRQSRLPAAEDVIWRERLRREIDQWRERQIECDQREQRCDDRESTLRGRETELWSRAESLYRRESRLQSQESAVLQLHDDYVQHQQDLIQLRERTHQQEQALKTRQAEFERQESEYQHKLEQASRQLLQSQQQAESATQAVQRMREQFESLNLQIDGLSGQQRSLEENEQRQRDEHQRQRAELERERNAAIDARAESEAKRQDAEQRVDEMAVELETLRATQGADLQEQLAELDENQKIIEELRGQVEQLQNTVTSASDESARLRSDYEEACQSVQQLEVLVAQSNQRGDRDRESWSNEADELRSAIDQLSMDLARANSEVSELSESNRLLTERLEIVTRDRDEAQSRPTHEAFESLRVELVSANEKLAQMRQDYESTIARLEEAKSRTETRDTPPTSATPEALQSDDDSGIEQDAIAAGLLGAAAFGVDASGSHDDDSVSAKLPLDVQADSDPSPSDQDEEVARLDDGLTGSSVDASEVGSHSIEQKEAEIDDEVWPMYQVASEAPDETEPSALIEPPHAPEDAEASQEAETLQEAETPEQFDSFKQSPFEAEGVETDSNAGFEAQAEARAEDDGWPSDLAASDEDELAEENVWDSSAISAWDRESDAEYGVHADVGGQEEPVGGALDPAEAEHFHADVESLSESVWNLDPPEPIEPETEDNTGPTSESDVDLQDDHVAFGDQGLTSDEASSEQTGWYDTAGDDSSESSLWSNSSLAEPDQIESYEREPDTSFAPGNDLEDVSAESDASGLGASELDAPESDAPESDAPESDAPGSEEVSENHSMVSGSLANMLIKDFEAESAYDEPEPYEGTYVMPSDFGSEASSKAEPGFETPSWDVEESDHASPWPGRGDDEPVAEALDHESVDGDEPLSEVEPSEQVFEPIHDEEAVLSSVSEFGIEPQTPLADADQSEAFDSYSPSDFEPSSDGRFGDEMHSPEEFASAIEPEIGPEIGTDPEIDPLPAPEAVPSERSVEPVDVESTIPESNEDDDSIEAYMNRLLNRVQGGPGNVAATKPETISLSTNPAGTSESVDEESVPSVPAPSEFVDPSAPMVPRSNAPERNSNMSAMRELANESARSAITRSVRIQTRNIQMAGMFNFAVAGIAGLAGVGAMFLVDGGLLYLAWAMAAIVAGISIRDGLGNFAEAKRRMRAAEEGKLDDELHVAAHRPTPEPTEADADH